MADNKRKVVKVDSNPVKGQAPGTRNPTQKAWQADEANDPVYDKYGEPKRPVIKIDSSKSSIAPTLGGAKIKTPIIKTSGLGGRGGQFGGQHAGGHAPH